jgi:hypothetical protein
MIALGATVKSAEIRERFHREVTKFFLPVNLLEAAK